MINMVRTTELIRAEDSIVDLSKAELNELIGRFIRIYTNKKLANLSEY